MLLYFDGINRITFRVMRRLYKLRMTKRYPFILYLVSSLLFVQWAQFHLHIYNNDPVISDHAHLNQVHSVYDEPGIEHHDKIADVDLTPVSIIKNIFLGSLFVAILTTLFIALLPRICILLLRRSEIFTSFIPWSNSQPPPLRAPPL